MVYRQELWKTDMSKSDKQYEKTFLSKLPSFIEERPINTISLIPPLIAGFLVVI
jgi:hypothetical protein